MIINQIEIDKIIDIENNLLIQRDALRAQLNRKPIFSKWQALIWAIVGIDNALAKLTELKITEVNHEN